jgi:hypothetical protein
MALAVEVHKGHTRRYRSILHRADGVEVELDGGAYNRLGKREVPHDIAHLIVEDELGLDRGVWGVLAAGGLFRGASVRAGRQKPHAARRGREVVAASVEQLNQAEMLVRVVCDAAGAGTAGLRARTGERWWSETLTEAAVTRAIDRLGRAANDWAALAPGGALRFTWRGRSNHFPT